MSDKVIFSNREKLEEIKKKIQGDGPGKLQVLSDFDKTMTVCFVEGKKIASVISILRDEKYLTPDYPEKAQALFEKYYPIENDTSLDKDEKSKLMREWWSNHYQLLIKSGLNQNDLKKVVQSEKLKIRPGALEFLGILKQQDIPLLILSASGLGVDAITLYLERYESLTENIHIVSNKFIWGEDGNAIGVEEPIVHTFNKDYSSVKNFSFYSKLKDRKNVLLLGDSLSDVDMLEGFEYKNVIKIGFLNENSKGELAQFKENYDVIILNDGSMDNIVDLFKNAFDVIIPGDGPMTYLNTLVEELVNIRN